MFVCCRSLFVCSRSVFVCCRSVSIEKCRHTTIVLGAVETVVHVNQCEQVKVIAVCRRLSTR